MFLALGLLKRKRGPSRQRRSQEKIVRVETGTQMVISLGATTPLGGLQGMIRGFDGGYLTTATPILLSR